MPHMDDMMTPAPDAGAPPPAAAPGKTEPETEPDLSGHVTVCLDSPDATSGEVCAVGPDVAGEYEVGDKVEVRAEGAERYEEDGETFVFVKPEQIERQVAGESTRRRVAEGLVGGKFSPPPPPARPTTFRARLERPPAEEE